MQKLNQNRLFKNKQAENKTKQKQLKMIKINLKQEI